MSLINQMLKDLENRPAPTENAKPLAGEVRAVSPRRSSLLPVWLLILLVVIAGGAAAWKLWLEPKSKAATAVHSALPKRPLPVRAQPKKEVIAAVTPSAPVQPPPPTEVVPEQVPSRLPGLEKTLSTLPADEGKDITAKATEKKVTRKSTSVPDSLDVLPPKLPATGRK